MSEAAARANWLRHHAAWPFVNDRPKRLGVAVSGGSDSMALLHLMAEIGRDRGFEVAAVTVDHGLRPEAKDEARSVGHVCEKLGIRHRILQWEGWDGTGNLQARARRARYALITDWARRTGTDWVALGHTIDDQAETVLMRLARRAGVDGLSAMSDRVERDGLTLIRPLLRLDRETLRAYLRDRGADWCEDPSNHDDSFERVRARRAMTTLSDLGIDADVLSDVATNARQSKWALDHYAYLAADDGNAVEVAQGDVILPEGMTPEHMIPHEVLRRLTNAAILWIGGGDYTPRAESLTTMVAEMSRTDRHTLGGCLVTRIMGAKSYDASLRITREYNAVRDTRAPTDALWDGRWHLDGPHAPQLETRALGDHITETPWRDTGLPRDSLRASPAVFDCDTLVAAPVAGLPNGWQAKATGRGTFARFLISR